MFKRLTVILIALSLALAACGPSEPVPGAETQPETASQPLPGSETAASEAASSARETTPEATHLQPEEGWQVVTIQGVEMLWDGYRVKEPAVDLDIDSMSFSDFGEDFFTEIYPVTTERYKLCEGEIMETEVVHIKAAAEGPVLYVVAGVHGDEIAAWFAGRLLRNATIKAGELYVVAPANANGAKNRTRYVTKNQDLNRSFPGDPEGNEAQRIANAIFRDIERVRPFMVFDLHEAIVYTAGRDFLGSNLIYSTLKGIEDLYFDLLFATEDGELCSNAFSINGPGPDGSINRTLADQLGIPAITVETFRGFPIERRVHDQLDVVQFAMQYVGMR